MVFLRIGQFLPVFAACLWGQSLFADDSVLSQAYGIGALTLILQDDAFRQTVGITDEQLVDIRKTLIENKLFVGDEDSIDSLAKHYISKTLKEDQAKRLRMGLVKRRFRTPTDLFQPVFLTELGLERENAVKINDSIVVQHGIISKRLDKLRIDAINDVLSPDEQDIFWMFIGKEFIIAETGVNWKDIAILPELTSRRQLSLAPFMPIPQKIGLSTDQKKRLQDLNSEAMFKSAKGIMFQEAELSSKLDGILSESQRFAIVQSMQQEILRGDLLMVLRPEVTKRVHLKAEFVSMARAELTESKRMIEDVEALELTQLCKDALKAVPLPARKVITDLVDGVWNLK